MVIVTQRLVEYSSECVLHEGQEGYRMETVVASSDGTTCFHSLVDCGLFFFGFFCHTSRTVFASSCCFL